MMFRSAMGDCSKEVEVVREARPFSKTTPVQVET